MLCVYITSSTLRLHNQFDVASILWVGNCVYIFGSPFRFIVVATLRRAEAALRHVDAALRHVDAALRHVDAALRHVDAALRHVDAALRHVDAALRHVDAALRHVDAKHCVSTTWHPVSRGGKLFTGVQKSLPNRNTPHSIINRAWMVYLYNHGVC